MSEFRPFESREELAELLAEEVAAQLQDAVDVRGLASLVVSGGSTPKPFFKALKRKALPWEKITITLADERWVMPDSDYSTEKLVREHLLHNHTHFISMAPLSPEEPLESGAQRINNALKECGQPFDVTILGMGEDAHTASLFPHHSTLQYDGDALCLAVSDSPKPPPERITLTPAAIEQSRNLIIHITGEGKKPVWEEAKASNDASLFPISRFIPKATTYWAA